MWIRTFETIINITENDVIKIGYDSPKYFILLYRDKGENDVEKYIIAHFTERDQAKKFIEKLFEYFKLEIRCVDIPLLISQIV